MSNINHSFKARCQGCIALQSGKEFSCQLGLPIKCSIVDGLPVQPAPDGVKCYKPKTAADLKAARQLTEAKIQKEKERVDA